MKFLSQIIAVYLPEINLLQLLATIAAALAFMKISVTNKQEARSSWMNRRKKRALENNMWAIH